MTHSSNNLISAEEALLKLSKKTDSFIDVRSEIEFEQGLIPGFLNRPILSTQERHEVGIAYRKFGQNAAIELGVSLTAVNKDNKIKIWLDASKDKESLILTCFRGGLRSQFAADWLLATGKSTLRVQGGYKAMRRKLITTFDNLPNLIVLTGFTGAGKTQILQKLQSTPNFSILDLEKMANHRGSSFGNLGNQPTQSTFENDLGFELFKQSSSYLLEDESAAIGKVNLPLTLKAKMKFSPIVFVDETVNARAKRIYQEYVIQPLNTLTQDELLLALQLNLRRIERKLGGAMTQEINQDLSSAFQLKNPTANTELHLVWIEKLLIHYYDKAYSHAFNKQERKVLFRGTHEECKSWLSDYRV